MYKRQFTLILVVSIFAAGLVSRTLGDEKSYKAWLMYDAVEDPSVLKEYQHYASELSVAGQGAMLDSAVAELQLGIPGLLGQELKLSNGFSRGIVLGTVDALIEQGLSLNPAVYRGLSDEGFLITATNTQLIISARTNRGLLYGAFHLLRLMQLEQGVATLKVCENPAIKMRLLNHWDNPGKVPVERSSVERGYAGDSIFKWDELQQHEQRYIDYARMLASTGINGSVINNVNTAKQGLEGRQQLT